MENNEINNSNKKVSLGDLFDVLKNIEKINYNILVRIDRLYIMNNKIKPKIDNLNREGIIGT
jgi:hypothetical protein